MRSMGDAGDVAEGVQVVCEYILGRRNDGVFLFQVHF